MKYPNPMEEALREAFERWLARHWNTIFHDGGYGDVVQLFADLKAASQSIESS